ncbi:hypothetical protein SDC9_160635 [bioreactor metagenome]|uniref:Uncharacterized protein n=1 Tax=bioreactor metagenome TaxID=1076179 RepID=A0A645FLM9_9ZZZZ
MLNQHGVGSIKCAGDIVRFGRNLVNLFFRETGGFQRFHRTAGTTTCGIQFVGRNRHHRGVFDVPTPFLHLFIQFLALTFADFGCRHHHQRDGIHRFAFGIDELIVHGDHFHVIAARLRDNGGTQFWIRGTNNKPLRPARRQAVNRIQRLLAVRHRNFNHFKAQIFPGFIGKFPLRLEPGFFRLFHQKTQFHRFCHSGL